MFKILKQSLGRGVVTNRFPVEIVEPGEGFRGKPVIDFARCSACDACAAACPTGAIRVHEGHSDPSVPAGEKHQIGRAHV